MRSSFDVTSLASEHSLTLSLRIQTLSAICINPAPSTEVIPALSRIQEVGAGPGSGVTVMITTLMMVMVRYFLRIWLPHSASSGLQLVNLHQLILERWRWGQPQIQHRGLWFPVCVRHGARISGSDSGRECWFWFRASFLVSELMTVCSLGSYCGRWNVVLRSTSNYAAANGFVLMQLRSGLLQAVQIALGFKWRAKAESP